jgi:DNA-binding transcriptional ArsR family regulator
MNAVTLGALSEPNRLRIVELLRESPLPVGEIAGRLRLRQPQASKHLHILSRAGIVRAQAMAQKRVYRLEPQPFADLEVWLNSFRPTWNARLDALQAYVREMQASSGGPAPRKKR